MADEPEVFSQISAHARKSFNEARTATSGVGKTAVLWAAALVIVWLSGLEPTWQNIVTTAHAFRQIHASQQEAELGAMIRRRQIAAEREKVTKLRQFQNQFPPGLRRENERIRVDRAWKEEAGKRRNFVNESGKILPAECDKAEACREALTAYSKAVSEKKQFEENERELDMEPLDKRNKRLDTENAELDKETNHLKEVYTTARQKAEHQERNVNFELFGQKFKAPLLLAPLLWCLLWVALLGYLARARAESIAYCAQGFRALASSPPSLSGDKLFDLTEQLPIWTVGPVLPAYTVALGPGKNQTLLAQGPWRNRVFGSSTGRQLVAAFIFLIPFIIWLTELRVVWIALEFSRYVGPTRMRALLPLALLAMLGITLWIGAWWFFGERCSPSLDWGRRRWLIGLSTAVLAIVSVCGWHPKVGIHFGFHLQQYLPWMAVISGGLFMVGVGVYMYGALGIDSQALPPIGRKYTRRGTIITMAAITSLVVLTTLPRFLGRVALEERHRKHSARRLSLKQGFYCKPPHSDEREVGNQRKDVCPAVLHYVGPQGRVSRRGSLPQVERLVKTDAPTSFYWRLADAPKPSMTENGVVSQPDADVAASLEDAPAHPVARRELPEPRVHLATASWSFEEAALDILRQVAVGRKKSGEVYELLHDLERVIGLTHDRRKKSGEVCELLLCGIHHDLVFKQRINKDGHPSFRLYDLLAGVSIRYEQKTYLEQLLKLIKDSKQQHIFQTRIQKWQDVTSPWRQRWRNRKEPITWKSNSGAVVF